MDLSNPNASTEALVRQFLAVLEQSPLSVDAHALRQRFEARSWKGLGPADLAEVAALVGRIPSSPEPQKAREEVSPWSALENLGAWVDAVPQGRQLLTLLEELARCDDGDAAVVLLKRLFVDHLRYEAHAVDETPRLTSTTVLRRLRTLARHGDFVVSLVELSFPYPYTSNFEPIFRRHPYGLVVAIAPGWNSCQFVYRVEKDASSLVQRTRSLLGFLWGDEGQDNLVLWVRRLDLLRPLGGEDGAAMLRRAESALAASPVDLSRQWPSLPLHLGEGPPGVEWNQLIAHERRAFLQEQLRLGERRWAWGLERALRESFPFGMALKQGRLLYRGYTLGGVNCPQAAFDRGGSWVRQLTLDLELLCEDGEAVPLSISATVPEMDATGRFLIDGTWLRWVPRVLREGLLVGGGGAELVAQVTEKNPEAELMEELLLPEQKSADSDLSSLSDVPPESSSQGQEAEDDPDWLSEEAGSPLSFAGASVRTLLEVAVFRKLYSLRLSVRAYEGKVRELPQALRKMLRSLAGRESTPMLVSKAFLKAFLVPDSPRQSLEGILPILRNVSLVNSDVPPAWACPEASACLPPGTWLPVSVARMNPCGELAVPLRESSRQERLCVSTLALNRVNPRVGGQGGGQASQWVAAELASFSTLPLGGPRNALPFVVRGHLLDERRRVLHVRGPIFRARAREDARLFPSGVRRRELRVRIPAFLVHAEAPLHRVFVSRGRLVREGDIWLEAPLALWARDAPDRPVSSQHLHATPSGDLLAHVFQMEEPEEPEPAPEGEAALTEPSDVARIPLPTAAELRPLKPILPDAAERWFVPPGVQGTVVEVREVDERDKNGVLLAWKVVLVVALDECEPPRGQLLMPDGRVASLDGGLTRQEVPYGEDGEPVDLVIEDPTLAPTPWSEIWFDGDSGELLETATSRLGSYWLLREELPVTGPDARLRFRARDGEGIPAAREAPAFCAQERWWWAAANPGEAATLAREARAWTGGLPGFWPHLAEALEAALVTPPQLPGAGTQPDFTERREIHFMMASAQRLRNWTTTYAEAKQDAPLRWGCDCERLQGRARAFERCSSCGAPVLLRPASRGRRPLPVFSLCESVLHPWRKETAAGLLGLTVAELERQCVKHGALLLGIRMYKAVRRADPGAAARERLVRVSSPAQRESLLRCLRAVERDVTALGKELPSRLLISRIPLLPAVLHPTGLPRGAPERVSAPLTEAYQRVHHASERLRRLRRSPSRLLWEPARRALMAEVDALWGPLAQERQYEEPAHLAGLLARLWPLTRAPGLRSVVPGTFRIQGRPVREATAPAREFDVDHISSAQAMMTRLTGPAVLGTMDGSPRNGVMAMRLRLERDASGITTTGVLTDRGPLYLPILWPLSIELSSPNFWSERAARERLLRLHLPWLCMVLGSFRVREHEGEELGRGVLESVGGLGPSRRALHDEAVELPVSAPLGALALRELMAGLAQPESRPGDFCRILEGSRPHACVSDGVRAAAALEAVVQRAFPGDGPWIGMSRRLLVRALVGWWKGPPSETSASGWRWLPPLEQGALGDRRYVPPAASVAWAEWPEMKAAIAPVRFLLDHEARPLEGHWSQTLRLLLGLEVEELPATHAFSEALTSSEQIPAFPLGVSLTPLPPHDAAAALPVMEQPSAGPGDPADELSFLTVSPEAWLAMRTQPPAERMAVASSVISVPESPPLEPKPEVVLLSSSMSHWLKRGLV